MPEIGEEARHTISFYNSEIGLWKNIIKKFYTISRKVGFNKEFSPNEAEMIEFLQEQYGELDKQIKGEKSHGQEDV